MRTTAAAIALLFALAACGGEPSAETAGAAGTRVPTGPEPLVVRVAATGGTARVYRYPALDAAIWESRAPLPADIAVLGFDADAGALLLLDHDRRPWRLTLGAGTVARAGETPLALAMQSDGNDIVGLADGAVLRFAATDATPWRVEPSRAPIALAALRKGTLLHVETAGATTTLMTWTPPDTVAGDTLLLDVRAHAATAAGGDRVFIAAGGELRSVATRTLDLRAKLAVDDTIVAMVPTPSGDRLYVLGRDGAEARVTVVDKYTDEILARVAVPATATALRMDPLGRSVLVRFGADSALAISVADDAPGRPFASGWRDDLPQVFPDGRIAALRGGDVLLVTPTDGRVGDVVAGGGGDIWALVTWNGFQRGPNRASGPSLATAMRRDSTRSDSGARTVAASPDSMGGSNTPRDSTLARPAPVPPAPPPAPTAPAMRSGWYVQFAALRAEGPARQLAGGIRVQGERARVLATGTDGIAVYRVILGPYPTREEAERVGAAAGRDFFVFDGGTP